MGEPPTEIPGIFGAILSRASRVRTHADVVVDMETNKTMSFHATQSRIVTSEKPVPADGTYRVLATLDYRGSSYRVFADLNVDDGAAHLRVFRFEVPQQDEWFAERKINLPVVWTDLAPLEQEVNGAEFVLRAPVRIDEDTAIALFGPSGPPVT